MIKPMLAATAALADIKYPVIASPKLDGVRGIVIAGMLMSRSLKTFPNPHVTARFSTKQHHGLDGELILGSPTAKDVYRVTNAACARKTGTPDVKFYVFDRHNIKGAAFQDRMPTHEVDEHTVVVDQVRVDNEKELLKMESMMLALGYEGLILRSPHAPYKYGRSTINEQGMLKLKRMTTSECEIIGFEEKLHNANEATTNELGRTARSSHKANMVPMNTLGALKVKDVETGIVFHIGSGFTDAERDEIWNHKKKYKGKIASYQHFEVGKKDLPRFPTWRGLRPEFDFPALS